jgi:hypothetical protein
MIVTLDPELESALKQAAQQSGTTPESLALDTLRQRFLAAASRIQARDEWEQGLLDIAVDCGVSLSNEAVSSEGIYE